MSEGLKTTEFWMTILTNIVTIVGSLTGVIPAQVAAIIIAAANGIYGVLRVITKTKAVTTTTTVTSGLGTVMPTITATNVSSPSTTP